MLEHGGYPFTLLEENGYEDEQLDFLNFDPAVVAEQFTLMDAVGCQNITKLKLYSQMHIFVY